MPYRSAILSAVEELKDHQIGSPVAAIRRHVEEHDTVTSNRDRPWNESLFQTTLKALVATGVLVPLNGAHYKCSDAHLARRAAGLRSRADSMEERRRSRAAALPPREAPSLKQDAPKKKTVRAKVKMKEGRTITVIRPRKKKTNDSNKDVADQMETEDT